MLFHQASILCNIVATNESVFAVKTESSGALRANGSGYVHSQPKQLAGTLIDTYVLSNMFAQFEHRFRIVDRECGMHLYSDLLGTNNLALTITSPTRGFRFSEMNFHRGYSSRLYQPWNGVDLCHNFS